jgi:multidrug resistance efflux pump
VYRIAAAFVVPAAAIILWLWWAQSQPEPFVVSGFVEADEIRVGSRVGGRVARVLVEEGQGVAKGELLYELDPFDLQERHAQVRAELAMVEVDHERLKAGFRSEEIEQVRAAQQRAQAVLDRLLAGPRDQEISAGRQRLNRAGANLELAETEFAQEERLLKQATAAEIDYQRAARNLKAARAELLEARALLQLLEEGTRAEEIAEARAVLAERQAALRLREAGYRQEEIAKAAARKEAGRAEVGRVMVQIDELRVTSPCQCVVEAIDLRPGDLVSANAPTVALLDLSRLWIRAYVPQARLGQVDVARRVPVSVDGFPNEQFVGRVTFVATEAEFTPRNVQTPDERSKQVFRIKVALDDGTSRLRPGMSADLSLDSEVLQ